MNASAKIQAIQLRQEGKSYSEIRDVQLTTDQKSRLSKLQATAYLGAKKKRADRLEHRRKIIEEAERQTAELVKNPFFVAGLMLYWAEGSKNIGSVQFSNSDPAVIKITSIPPGQFYKPYIKPTILSHKKNKLYEGTCRIVIHNRGLLSKIIGWKNGVEKIFSRKSNV